jgi:RNA polymerase-binding transcription factor DksA
MHPLSSLALPKLEACCEILLRQHDETSRRALANAVQALHRIDNGTYGFCEACGDRIDDLRLLARLSVRHCASCATFARPNADVA